MRIHKKIGLLAFTLLFISSASFAANLGDACSNANQIVRERGVGANTGIVCDGSNYVVFKSYDTAPLRNGIGTTTPAATLDVNGEIKVGNTSLSCSATTEGAMRYNSSTKVHEFCNGTGWGTIVTNACDNDPTVLSFTTQNDLATSTLTESNIVLVTDMDAGCLAAISISGTDGNPQYRTCSNSDCSTEVQTWTGLSNSLDIQGDYIQLRATSSASEAVGFTVTVGIGTVSRDWAISTGVTGCFPEGTICADGTVYAGLSGASTPMYVTRCDAGMTWDGSACTGTRITKSWNNGNNTGYVTTGVTSIADGQGNTATLITIDSDSSITGMQPHNAAQYCADLTMHGYSDWYLPAKNELNTIYTNEAVIANFDTSGSYYWTSTGSGNQYAGFLRFSDGVFNHLASKYGLYHIRCARR